MVVLVPWLFVEQYDFRTWFYRALVFLVISCPCALVVSIPLGYFGGIGLASRNGILVKGANYLDIMTQIDTLVMDKTGTITKGEFTVTQVSGNGMDKAEILAFAAALETQSTHPIAQAILNHASKENLQVPKVTALTEIPGHGLSGTVSGRSILAGNLKLLKKFQVEIPAGAGSGVETVVFVAVDQQFAGTISISDTIKDDAAETISALHRLNIHTVMLSGDKP